jgi:type IV pilus assembly protein PilC
MPVFKYNAIDNVGVRHAGERFASNRDHLTVLLAGAGLYLVRAKSATRGTDVPERIKISHQRLQAFTTHVATYLDSGITLSQALSSMSREVSDPQYRAMVEGLGQRIAAGVSFSEALSNYPRIFSAHFVAVVRAGEAGGCLAERMYDLEDYLEWQGDLKRQITKSAMYPIMLLSVLCTVISIFVFYVLPKFLVILKDFDIPLPFATRMVIAAMDFIQGFWPIIIAAIAVPIVTWVSMGKTQEGQYWRDKLLLSVPLLGNVLLKLSLSRFANNFAILISAGIETLESLTLVEGVVGNRVIARVVRDIRGAVEIGSSISSQLVLQPMIPDFVVQLCIAGEETGQLDNTFKKVAKHYNKEVPATIDNVFKVLEPLILVGMGVLVVLLGLAILLPIYQFGSKISG